ncbi:glycine cleavage system protein H [Terrimonas alba]|uniref:glycine cleavage system protein H n=1 Tax=Terrimonas alba TaxID=3349636 RepID=UPI0035F38F52
MKTEQPAKKDLYYTKDHEWIDFQGTIAYVGICGFKLLGFKEIQQLTFNEPAGFKKQGEVLATIRYNDYQIEAHMPVDGKVLEINNSLGSGNVNMLIAQPEGSGWIAKIIPAQPYERKDLLMPKEYQMNGKGKSTV